MPDPDDTTKNHCVGATPSILSREILSPGGFFLPKGFKEQLKLIVTFSDGSKKDVTSDAAWASNSPDVPVSGGLVDGTVASTATGAVIDPTYQGMTTSQSVNVSNVSLMPEGIEKQLKPQEIADLFAFLCLDRPPEDPGARRIPGTPKGL